MRTVAETILISKNKIKTLFGNNQNFPVFSSVYRTWSMSLVRFYGANTGIASTCHTEKIKTKRRQDEDCIS